MQIRSLGRVDLPLGEALRLEMVTAGQGGEDVVHLQYYVATELGPWALWLSCAREDLADREAALLEIAPPFAGDQRDQPPAAHGGGAPFPGWEGDST
jgi:hypothetical protein